MYVFAADTHYGLQDYFCVCCRHTSWDCRNMYVFAADTHQGLQEYVCVCCRYTPWTTVLLRFAADAHYTGLQKCLRHIGLREYASYRTAGICKHHTRLQAYAIIPDCRLHISVSCRTAGICKHHTRLQAYAIIPDCRLHISVSCRTAGICQLISDCGNMSATYRNTRICLGHIELLEYVCVCYRYTTRLQDRVCVCCKFIPDSINRCLCLLQMYTRLHK